MIRACMEYNEGGCQLWAMDDPGAYARGKTLQEAETKLPGAVARYRLWAGARGGEIGHVEIAQTIRSELPICDADSDALLDTEIAPLDEGEYLRLRDLAIRSALDFQTLYDSISDPDAPLSPARKTFYGDVPRTAREMYVHVNNVTDYYMGEIGVVTTNLADIAASRRAAFEAAEATPGLLENRVFAGSYDEKWTLRKVLRRFLWHDGIHARAMYRNAMKIWGAAIVNPFGIEPQ